MHIIGPHLGKAKVKNKGFIGRGMMMGISALGKLIGRTLATQFLCQMGKVQQYNKATRVCFYHFTSFF